MSFYLLQVNILSLECETAGFKTNVLLQNKFLRFKAEANRELNQQTVPLPSYKFTKKT